MAEGDRVDVVASLASRTFGGFESLQLIVRDVAPSGSHPEAAAILARGRSTTAASGPSPEPAVRRGPAPAYVTGRGDR